jgi:hypothetical protein
MQGDTVRPKTIVYFEWIILGTLLLSFLSFLRELSQLAQFGHSTAGNFLYLLILIRIITFVVIGTLTLLISRRRSKIATWVLIAWFALNFARFVTSLSLLRTASQLGYAIVSLAFLIVRGVACGLLFTPSARRWMNRDDKKNEKLREVFE